MAKRSETTANLREKRFVRILSLGSGMSTAQRTEIGPGCFAINAEGLLVAFTSGTQKEQGQTIIAVAPVASFVKEVEELAKGGVDLGFPLPKDRNIIDPATMDRDFHPMNIATIMNNHKESERLLKGLRVRHPDSHALRMTFYRQQNREGGAGALLPDFPAPGPDEPAAHQVDYWSMRADILSQRQELDEAIKARKKAVELSPKDYCNDRFKLAHLYAYLGRNEEAETLLREALALWPEYIKLNESLVHLLDERGKSEEAFKLTERVIELERIYQKP
jgi:tetratricopeptide (TPR) repeat protein